MQKRSQMEGESMNESPEAKCARGAVIARALFGFSEMTSGSQKIIARANMEETYRRYTEYLASLSKTPT